jgi:hypothetical protein
MGYARIFSIKEAPIRAHIATEGKDQKLAEDVGLKVLRLSASNSFEEPFSAQEQSECTLPLFEAGDPCFIPFRSFHSTDAQLLLWTGRRFTPLWPSNELSFAMLLEIEKATAGDNRIKTLSKHQQNLAIAKGKFESRLEQDADTSHYWIYEDFSRDFSRTPERDWPIKEVGEAILKLMLSEWSRSESIRNHGNVVNRCCTLISPEAGVYFWGGNCLRTLDDLDDEELTRLQAYLTKDTNAEQGRGANALPRAAHD